MGVTINVNGLSLVHKGSGGVAMATVPDVCKTPSPGGPVPVPYPNIARSASLAKGSTTVKVDGGNSAANKGSEFSASSGDEAGTLGGVKSGVNMKEATWLTYSMDVKIEGKNAARLTDKMLMNHGNTVCLAGEGQMIVKLRDLQKVAAECDESVNEDWDRRHPNGPKHTECVSPSGTGRTVKNSKTGAMEPEPTQVALGIEKEACVNARVQDTETRTQQQPFDRDGVALPRGTIPGRGGGTPDFVTHSPGIVTNGGDVVGVFDLKFPCPSEAGKRGRWREGQLERYQELFPGAKFIRIVCPRGIFP
jgi:hypothetical protein